MCNNNFTWHSYSQQTCFRLYCVLHCVYSSSKMSSLARLIQVWTDVCLGIFSDACVDSGVCGNDSIACEQPSVSQIRSAVVTPHKRVNHGFINVLPSAPDMLSFPTSTLDWEWGSVSCENHYYQCLHNSKWYWDVHYSMARLNDSFCSNKAVIRQCC